MEIKYTKRFRDQYNKVDKKIKSAFAQTLDLLLTDPYSPFLRNHPLRDKFTGYRSINITDDWRAIFKQSKSGRQTIITFHFMGTHKELYR